MNANIFRVNVQHICKTKLRAKVLINPYSAPLRSHLQTAERLEPWLTICFRVSWDRVRDNYVTRDIPERLQTMCRFVIYKGSSPVQLSHVSQLCSVLTWKMVGITFDSSSHDPAIRSSTKLSTLDFGLIANGPLMAMDSELVRSCSVLEANVTFC